MDDARLSTIDGPTGFSRRHFLLGGLGLGVLAGASALGLDFWFDSGVASADTSGTYTLGSGTAPEQIHLEWGDNPATEVTVSWGAPGTTPQPAPSVAYGTSPISSSNPGTAGLVSVRSFTDGMNLQTTYYYHATLTGLTPGTTYYYVVSDGASPASTVASSFQTAPVGRVPFTFTSYGDLGTPRSANLSSSGHSWAESSDNAYYAVNAVEGATPLFHLLNGDLCYANLNTNNQPGVWRDFGNNIQRSAANRPWMPCLGNHEIEFGADNQDGSPNVNGNGGWNGPYGYGAYQTRFQLPDNGISGYQGNFYSFQVGTVLFISLDADDVIYQDGGSYTLTTINSTNTYPPNNKAINIPAGSSTYNNQYTGTLAAGPGNSLVPSGSKPNAQTQWLAAQLSQARSSGSTVDMIVVQMHQCALSSSSAGNGSDLGIRQAWLPLFDQYGVDLVLSGHEHNYERSYAVRGYDNYYGTVVAPNPGQTTGAQVLTRRPTKQPAAGPLASPTNPSIPAFDTTKGTVFLVLGGGGTDGPTNKYGTDSANGSPQAKVITTRNLIYQNTSGAYVKNGADSVEDAPWSANVDATDAYGFATFQVNPGSGPGQTTILMTYQHAPQVAPSSGGATFTGTTSYSTYEQVLFGHNLPAVPYGPPAATPEFPAPALAAGAAVVAGAGALALRQRRRGPSSSSSDG